MNLLEPLEPRVLMTGLPSLSALGATPHFVVGDASATLLATLPGKNVTIAEDSTSGSTLEVMVNWGDGSTSPATLHRANGKIQVWSGHAYTTVKNYRLSLVTSVDGQSRVLQRNAVVQLNADRGRTLVLKAGQAFAGWVSLVDRTAGLPKLTTPVASLDLPAGSRFAQYTVGDTGGKATVRVDWGDGDVTDAMIVSYANGKYRVLGEHIYSTTGVYRVTTYVVINAPDNALLHMDMIASTARVRQTGTIGGLPGTINLAVLKHEEVTWSDVLPEGTTMQFTPVDGGTLGTTGTGTSQTSGGTGAVVLNSGGLITSGTSAGVLHLGSGGVTGASGFLQLATGTVTLVGSGTVTGAINNEQVITAHFGNFTQSTGTGTIVLNGTQAGLLTLGNSLQLSGGGTLSGGTSQIDILHGILSGGGSLWQLPASLTITGGGTLTNTTTHQTGSGVIVVNPLEPPTIGTLTTGGTLIGSGTVNLNGGILNVGTQSLLSGTLTLAGGTLSFTNPLLTVPAFNLALTGAATIHLVPGVTFAAPSPLLTMPWTLHADGSISLDSATGMALFDSASTAVIVPQRHSGLITCQSDVPLEVVNTTVALLPGDFSGTITLPAGTDAAGVTALAALSGATVLTLA